MCVGGEGQGFLQYRGGLGFVSETAEAPGEEWTCISLLHRTSSAIARERERFFGRHYLLFMVSRLITSDKHYQKVQSKVQGWAGTKPVSSSTQNLVNLLMILLSAVVQELGKHQHGSVETKLQSTGIEDISKRRTPEQKPTMVSPST